LERAALFRISRVTTDLDQHWLSQIRENLAKKRVEELAAIYSEQDTAEWSPEAFEVIREIFHGRNLPLPSIKVAQVVTAAAKGPQPIRSYSLQGIGTTLIGRRDFCSDGSYITTQWFTLFWIPMFPMRSLRVRHKGHSSETLLSGIRWSTSYEVHEQTRPNGRQVLYIYAFVLLYILWVVSLLANFDPALKRFGEGGAMFLVWLAFGPPAFIPFIMRHCVRRNVRASCSDVGGFTRN
jgi:hypothetical protein